MENYLDTFAFVKVLKTEQDRAGLFADGMRCNYELEGDGNEHLKYVQGAYWVDCKPNFVNQVGIGGVFVGVSKADSKARKYVVIAKDKEGRSVWFPLESKEDAEMLIYIWKYDEAKKDLVLFLHGEESIILDLLRSKCEEGVFYMSTDINRNMLPLFDIEDDYDEDDDEDDDDEEVLDPEDQEVLDSLKDVTSDEDDDRSEFSTMDCIFTCFKNHEDELQFFTVAQGLKIEDDIHDIEHYLYHANEDLKAAMHRVETMTASKANAERVRDKFNDVFKKTFSKITIGTDTVKEQDTVLPELTDIPKSSDDVKVQDTAITRGGVDQPADEVDDTDKFVTHEEFIKAEEAQEDEDRKMEESVPNKPDIHLPGDTKPLDPFTDSESKVNIDEAIMDCKAVPENIDLPESTPILDKMAGGSEPFGADDSKWEGPDEYGEEPKSSFGNW